MSDMSDDLPLFVPGRWDYGSFWNGILKNPQQPLPNWSRAREHIGYLFLRLHEGLIPEVRKYTFVMCSFHPIQPHGKYLESYRDHEKRSHLLALGYFQTLCYIIEMKMEEPADRHVLSLLLREIPRLVTLLSVIEQIVNPEPSVPSEPNGRARLCSVESNESGYSSLSNASDNCNFSSKNDFSLWKQQEIEENFEAYLEHFHANDLPMEVNDWMDSNSKSSSLESLDSLAKSANDVDTRSENEDFEELIQEIHSAMFFANRPLSHPLLSDKCTAKICSPSFDAPYRWEFDVSWKPFACIISTPKMNNGTSEEDTKMRQQIAMKCESGFEDDEAFWEKWSTDGFPSSSTVVDTAAFLYHE